MLSNLKVFACSAILIGTVATSTQTQAEVKFHIAAQAGVQSVIDVGPRMIVAVSGSVQDGAVSYFLTRLEANVGTVTEGESYNHAWLSGYHLTLTPVSMVVHGDAAAVEGAGVVGSIAVSFLPMELQRELAIGVDTKAHARVIGVEGQLLAAGATDVGIIGVAAELSLQMLGYEYLAMNDRLISSNSPFHGIEIGSASAEVKALWGFFHSGPNYVKQLSIGIRATTDIALGLGDSADVATSLIKVAGRIALGLRLFGMDHALYFETATMRQHTFKGDLFDKSAMPLILEAGLITRFN